MLNHIDLRRGIYFVLDGAPCVVLDHALSFKGRGSSVMQIKFKNLKTGNILNRTFHTGDALQEAQVEKVEITFVYQHRGAFVFSETNNPKNRFELSKEQLGDTVQFLLPNTVLEGVRFADTIINVSLPIKMQFKVAQAPPGVKGDRAQGGTKTVTLETGATIQVPLFVEQGDVVEVNTETGEYAKRVQ
jgi:elongation factor P